MMLIRIRIRVRIPILILLLTYSLIATRSATVWCYYYVSVSSIAIINTNTFFFSPSTHQQHSVSRLLMVILGHAHIFLCWSHSVIKTNFDDINHDDVADDRNTTSVDNYWSTLSSRLLLFRHRFESIVIDSFIQQFVFHSRCYD